MAINASQTSAPLRLRIHITNGSARVAGSIRVAVCRWGYGDHTSSGSVSVENPERGFMLILACIVVDKVIILLTNFHVEKDFTVEFSEKYTV